MEWKVVFWILCAVGWSMGALEVTIYHNGDTDYRLGQFIYDNQQCLLHNSVEKYLQSQISSSVARDGDGKFLNSIGIQITVCQEIEDVIIFLPSNDLFIWPSFELGHLFVLPDIIVPDVEKPVTLLTLSVRPRIFVVDNLISDRESEFLIQYMSNKSSEDDGLDISLVGDAIVSNVRTSMNGWDSESTVAIDLKGRCMEMLRVYQADDDYFERIQIARYRSSQYYDLHYDYFPANEAKFGEEFHDWNIEGNGTNRFITVLFYLSDVAEGGETIFPFASRWWNEKARKSVASGNEIFPEKTRSLDNFCHDENLKITPRKLRALLFYSQTPYHQLDPLTRHGSCPVHNGVKWIATIWMWNGPISTAQPELSKQKSSLLPSSSDFIVVMFSLSDDFDNINAELRLLDPRHEVAGTFRQKKPIVVNSEAEAHWTVVLMLDTITNESLVVEKIIIKPSTKGGKLQHYIISLSE